MSRRSLIWQSGQFSNEDKYAHGVYLCDSAKRFSVWYSAAREFQDAEGIDAANRSYPITRKQRKALCRLLNLTDTRE